MPLMCRRKRGAKAPTASFKKRTDGKEIKGMEKKVININEPVENLVVQAQQTVCLHKVGFLGPLHVRVETGGRLEACFFQTGQACDISVDLAGKEASCDIKAVYLVRKKEENILNIKVRHSVPFTFSHQMIRGILTQEGQGVFNGLVRMQAGAQKSEGDQSHKALLLSDKARVRGQPELEIFADDVKCSHGNAIGSLDDEKLFYLRTRGFNEAAAQKLLIRAFAAQAVLPEWESLLDEWLAEIEIGSSSVK